MNCDTGNQSGNVRVNICVQDGFGFYEQWIKLASKQQPVGQRDLGGGQDERSWSATLRMIVVKPIQFLAIV